MDIVAKEVLEDALFNYLGAIVIISHDRYFLSRLANKIFAFERKSVVRYDMDYHDYMKSLGPDFQDRVTKRYVAGDNHVITNAKKAVVPLASSHSKNFGGSGVSSGKPEKGIKNFNRYKFE